MFRSNLLTVYLVFSLFLLSLISCDNEVVIATNNPGADSVFDSGNEIVLNWSYKPIEKNVEEAVKKSQYFQLSDVDNIVIQFMTGSDLQNLLIKNLTTVKPSDNREYSFKAPKFPFKGTLFFFRYIIYFRDASKGVYRAGDKGYTINWSTRFDIYPTDKGEEIDPSTLIEDKTKPTAVKSYNPPPKPSAELNPDFSNSKVSSTLSALTLVGLAILSTYL